MAYVDLKSNWWLSSMTKYATPLQISVNRMKIDNLRSLLFLRSKGQHGPKGQHGVNNLGGISKILNFHPIDLKFEEDLYFTSLNSSSQLFFEVSIDKKST